MIMRGPLLAPQLLYHTIKHERFFSQQVFSIKTYFCIIYSVLCLKHKKDCILAKEFGYNIVSQKSPSFITLTLGFVFIWMYFLFGFETHLSLWLWRLQTADPNPSNKHSARPYGL